MAGAALIWLAGALAVAGVIVLRLSWARPVRSSGVNAAGWGLLLAGVIVAASEAGAWGVAVASLFATGAAMVLLFKAVFEQPRWTRPAKPIRQPAKAAVDEGSSVGRGLATFAIAGPLALIASVLVALAGRLALLASGAVEADGNVAVLGLVPLVWPILAFALLMIEKRKTQLAVVGVIAIAALVPVILAGGNT